jgi:hypothetical protein
MLRISLYLILALCFVPVAGATSIMANGAGCNGGGGGSCASGPYTLGPEGDQMSWTFDYSIPNSEVKQFLSIDDVTVGVEVWNYPDKKDTSPKSFSIYLLVGGEDITTATHVWLLGTVGPTTLAGFDSGNRDVITETLDSSDLAAFLAALKKSKGDFEVEVVATGSGVVGVDYASPLGAGSDTYSQTFNLGQRQTDDSGNPVRFASLDVDMPEPASLGTAGIGLLALCWALRKKIAR